MREVLAAFDRATVILRTRRGDLDRGAELLLSKETLAAEEFLPIQTDRKVPTNAMAFDESPQSGSKSS